MKNMRNKRWKKIVVSYQGYENLTKSFRTRKAADYYCESIRDVFGDFMYCYENVEYVW